MYLHSFRFFCSCISVSLLIRWAGLNSRAGLVRRCRFKVQVLLPVADGTLLTSDLKGHRSTHGLRIPVAVFEDFFFCEPFLFRSAAALMCVCVCVCEQT